MNIATAPLRADEQSDASSTSWPVAGRLIDAITRRSFDDVAGCLDPDVRMRAVLPSGLLELHGADVVAARFDQWFGGKEGFLVLDACLGAIGPRQYLQWRIRMWDPGEPDRSRVVEQHAFTRGSDHIEVLDLLCSGFHEERGERDVRRLDRTAADQSGGA